jgi:hypothetical protein
MLRSTKFNWFSRLINSQSLWWEQLINEWAVVIACIFKLSSKNKLKNAFERNELANTSEMFVVSI